MTLVDADPQGHPLTPPQASLAELGRLAREGQAVIVVVYSDGEPAMRSESVTDALRYIEVVRDAGQIAETLDIRFELDRRDVPR